MNIPNKVKLNNIDFTVDITNVEAPNGKKLHNHLLNGGTGTGNIKILKKDNTLIDDILIYNAGCEYGEF